MTIRLANGRLRSIVEHLNIWIRIAALVLGGVALLDTYQLGRKIAARWIRPASWCLLSLNLFIFTGLLADYLLVNLFGSKSTYKVSVLGEVIDPLSSLTVIGLSYWMVKLVTTLKLRAVSQAVFWLVIALGLGIACGAGWNLIAERPSMIHNLFTLLHVAALVVSLLAIFGLLAYLAVARTVAADTANRKMWNSLGRFYLGGCAFTLATATFAGPYQGAIWSGVVLAFNLFSIYFNRRMMRLRPGLGSAVLTGAHFDEVCLKFTITARHREIVELVVQGRSNKEIAETLFIAPHTVKNHLYALYQRLGVKSRYELIGLFTAIRRD